ncbi:MAG: UDP-N-acetylmuramoyl-tripeptide--D-alanyl-D-alanine ligase [Saprospiraceae bacterium]|nr:UDP-N-acetylmuramoyl-tripeptide--D-alanyl-D-alanine ligase [Saprospiraceae bacterium]
MTYRNVSIDSRKITPGCIFFALKGENFDGNKYAQMALDMGAVLAVVDDASIAINENYFLVDDVLSALQQLAHHYRKQLTIPVLAITGSNGKTTTKELCRDVLKQKYIVKATQGNLNNHIGVPLTLLSTNSDVEFLIVEMGANHQGEIHALCMIAEPQFGMITNIGKAHLEGFGGVEGIKKGKSEMYKDISEKSGLIFINGEDEVLKSLVPKGTKVITYMPSQLVRIIDEDPFITFSYKGRVVNTQLFGGYNVPNIAFAIAVGEYFGVNTEKIILGLESYIPENNRSQRETIGTNTYIKDAYNANPSSMKLSIESFAKMGDKNKILVLGDMLELGQYTESEHIDILKLTERLGIKEKIFVGDYFYAVKDGHSGNFFKDIKSAKVYFDTCNFKYSTILLKGSRGIAIEKIIS